jgi:hypothetical protein
VQSGSMPAEFGFTPGGVINPVTRSGTNQLQRWRLWAGDFYQRPVFLFAEHHADGGIPAPVFTLASAPPPSYAVYCQAMSRLQPSRQIRALPTPLSFASQAGAPLQDSRKFGKGKCLLTALR